MRLTGRVAVQLGVALTLAVTHGDLISPTHLLRTAARRQPTPTTGSLRSEG